ncbi:hypothetical protein B0H16DRAFT_1472448 [Mycena metata]|uniref:Uncharacterized protein n=1 Tax=Mycena metata TaxID=1033252 RepID=A0AAD7HN61_9AGAR|nr:hypothetical protein B0H16DRAFT_1472448 [Mycena metata]
MAAFGGTRRWKRDGEAVEFNGNGGCGEADSDHVSTPRKPYDSDERRRHGVSTHTCLELPGKKQRHCRSGLSKAISQQWTALSPETLHPGYVHRPECSGAKNCTKPKREASRRLKYLARHCTPLTMYARGLSR